MGTEAFTQLTNAEIIESAARDELRDEQLRSSERKLARQRNIHLQTFVDPARFRGTCYRAANWIPLGTTTGCGKADPTRKPTRSVKEVLGYPLTKHFRARLSKVP